MTNNQHNPDNTLDRAAGELRDLPSPAGPDDVFQQQLVVRLRASGEATQAVDLSWQRRRTIMRPGIILAASVIIVFAAIGWIVSLDGSSGGSAFAHMLQQVENARTVVFKTRVEMRGIGHNMESKTMLLEPDWIRDEMTEGDDQRVAIHVHNLKERRSLTLMPAMKKALVRTFDAQPRNIIDQIRDVRESSAEFLGDDVIDGKDTRKYRCDHPTGHYLMWLAADSDLPVKVVMSEVPAGATEYVTITLTNFQWNVPLDTSLFTLDVPEGYDLEAVPPAPSALDPKYLVDTLRVYVRVNNDQFPDEFNALTPASIIQFLDDPSLPQEQREAYRRRKLAHALDRPELEKASAEEWKKQGPQMARMFAGSAAFLQVLAQSHDWHYVGKGVKLGEADRIVAWWTPKGDAPADEPKSATVLYGDLHVENKPAADLPTGN